jgi:hypothetical protein
MKSSVKRHETCGGSAANAPRLQQADDEDNQAAR